MLHLTEHWMTGTWTYLFSNQHSCDLRTEDAISSSKTWKRESRNMFGISLSAFKPQRIKIAVTLCEMLFTFWVKMTSEWKGIHSGWEGMPTTSGEGTSGGSIGSWKGQIRIWNQKTRKPFIPFSFIAKLPWPRFLLKLRLLINEDNSSYHWALLWG